MKSNQSQSQIFWKLENNIRSFSIISKRLSYIEKKSIVIQKDNKLNNYAEKDEK